ncbi:hypothetical protein BN8_02579 [Fibrisoma limi BUZ 3]|uniref:Ferritin-like domain-containing protein n=1 Tax=Fibrisoma limi BUZ 3 TaxID=1185876 RepID=I2GHV6_9BACT|nr:ferritin-like domain-containing protein [Fibrisoma limi]CCH53481.1 hypothetical protein BN8_02579 [Fibrisoma limi BUZ 3]
MFNVMIDSVACNGKVGRRWFMQVLGVTSAATGLTACSNLLDDENPYVGGVQLGRDDVGVLNYAYALEQLEAAFYTQMLTTPYAGITPEETQLLTDIRDHEIIHREFLRTALGGDAIESLELNFGSLNFADRAAILAAARQFENTGVAAYNGAGKLLKNPDFLTLAGKIVSVEARHAALIADLLQPRTAYFASDEVVAFNGLENVQTPEQVLSAVRPYTGTVVNGDLLPTT